MTRPLVGATDTHEDPSAGDAWAATQCWLPRGASPEHIVVDGCDGVGKSAVCVAVAARVGGHVLSPFAGTAGDHIAWLHRSGRSSDAGKLALECVWRALSHGGPGPLVFDRHWATVFTILPADDQEAWRQLPPTVLLTADVEVILERHGSRGESVERAHIERLITRYDEVARAEDVLVLDTSRTEVEEVADAVIAEWQRWLCTRDTRSPVWLRSSC